ncbi:MAG: ferritin-like domain-containing protein [Chloroflexi bacterium]|nr:ferritin-like domain-containing protein [Chloroflexota bacterium]
MTTLYSATGRAPIEEFTPALVPVLQQQAAACESIQEIINIAATAEAFAVTALGGAIESANAGTLALNEEQIQTLVAARAAEQAHYDFLTGAGAEPLTLTFTIPDPAILTDVPTFLLTTIGLEEAFIAAYIAAAQVFVQLGNPDLAQVALQIGAVEAEHRAGLRFYAIQAGVLAGTPNDVAFERALFTTVGEAAVALQELGFIGGTGTEVTYPGPGEIDTSGVEHLQP